MQDKPTLPTNNKPSPRDGQTIKPPRLLQIVEPALSHSQEFMLSDLARSGLTPEDISAEPLLGFEVNKRTIGYRIPYFTLDGSVHPRMYRIRLLDPDSKYDGPSREKIDNDCTYPYIPPQIHSMDCSTLIICEGEKKTAAVIKHLGIPAIGIGGSGNWREGKKKIAIHSIILAVAKKLQVKRILIIPDSDVKRYDQATEYGTFRTQLMFENYEVELLNPPGKIDDLLMEWGKDARALFASLPRITSFVENAAVLAEHYGLGHKKNVDGRVVLEQNIANVLLLLRQHDSFPHIWYNEDISAIMFDDKPMQGDVNGIDIQTYLQHNLQLPKVTTECVRRAIARRSYDDKRSPFRDWLEKLEWDGQPRIERFFINYCASPDTKFTHEAGLKWLPGAVWRTMEPGCPVDYMLISQGPQGKGKSTLPNLLWGVEYVKTILGKENQQKDDMSKYHMGKLISFEEFDTMYTTNIGHLKGTITNHVDTFRKPYDVDGKSHKRSCIFYASTNKNYFLKRDDTGYRRFPVVPFGQLNFNAVIVDREQLWAEAVFEYRRHKEAGTLFQLSEISGTTEAVTQYANVEDYINAWDEFVSALRAGNKFPLQRHEGYVWMKTSQAYQAADLDGRMGQEAQKTLKEYMLSTGWVYFDKWKTIEGKRIERVYVLNAS